MKEKLNTRSASVIVQSSVKNVGKMSRQCFNTFERVSKLWETLKSNIAKAADAYVPNSVVPLAIVPSSCDAPPTPKQPRLSDLQEGQSPEVKVSEPMPQAALPSHYLIVYFWVN